MSNYERLSRHTTTHPRPILRRAAFAVFTVVIAFSFGGCTRKARFEIVQTEKGAIRLDRETGDMHVILVSVQGGAKAYPIEVVKY